MPGLFYVNCFSLIFGWFSGRNVRRLHSPRHCLRRCVIRGRPRQALFSFFSCLTAIPEADFLPGALMGTPRSPDERSLRKPDGSALSAATASLPDRFIIHEFPPRCNRLHHIFRIALPAAQTPGRAKTPTGQKSRGIPSLPLPQWWRLGEAGGAAKSGTFQGSLR